MPMIPFSRSDVAEFDVPRWLSVGFGYATAAEMGTPQKSATAIGTPT